MTSLIFPTQGNVIAIKRTIESFKHICNEIVIGSVCVFEDDLKQIDAYGLYYNLKIINLPFNFIYRHGFSETLNLLAKEASNDKIIYANVGETIESNRSDIMDVLKQDYNSYYIDNATESFRWWRCYNKKELEWSGLIHEMLVGEHRPFHKPILRFMDTEKDQIDLFKSCVYNDIKEICYWNQLIRIADDPELLAGTDIGWVQFAKDNYQSMKDRLALKGNRPKAFESGNLQMYLDDIYSNAEFEKERFESNHIIEFQGSPMYLGKK